MLLMNTKLANWPAPTNVRALSTTRNSGFSLSPYNCNNLALHVGDDPMQVLKNRQQTVEMLQLPCEPVWLEQTHSTRCIIAEKDSNRQADAAVSHSYQHPLVVLTADCLPITLCNIQGTEIAAIHAGWKGLCQGIIENTLSQMKTPPSELLAWMGPAICRQCYEVGEEVYLSFTQQYPESKSAFKPRGSKWLAGLAQIAEIILHSKGVTATYQSNLCTLELKDEFYSYRRESQTGRIGTLIWFTKLY